MARGGAPGGGGGTLCQRVWSIPNGMTSTFALVSRQLGRERQVRPARHHHRAGSPDDLPGEGAVHRPAGVGVLGHDHRGVPGAQQAGQIGERVGMMDVDDVGPFPGGRNVARGNLLRAKRRKGEGAGDQRPMAAGFAAPSQAFDRHHLDLVTEFGRAFGQRLNHALHAPGPGPVVLREVQNAHGSGHLGWSERPFGLYSHLVPATSPDIPTAVN